MVKNVIIDKSLYGLKTSAARLHEHLSESLLRLVFKNPISVKQQFQQSKDIVRLVEISVLEKDYSSEWASCIPSFAIPKKNGTIRVVTDFRKKSTQLIVET
jgi:hypothetical protein